MLMGYSIRRELMLLLSSPLARIWWITSCALAVGVVLTPSLVLGNEQTYGMAAFPRGLLAGGVAACVLGPVVVLMMTGTEFDTGIREQRIALGGTTPARLSFAQLTAALVSVIGAVLLAAVISTVGGLSDQGIRAIFSNAVPVRLPSSENWASAMVSTVLGLGCTTASWLVVHALRSGVRASCLLVLVLASWPVMLTVRFAKVGVLLSIHPLALPWSLMVRRYPIRVDPWIVGPALTAWILIVGVFAWHGVTSPSRRTGGRGARLGRRTPRG